jgi:hypothetical protein
VWVPLWNPVTEDFCIEFASSLAIMLIELNAELEDFAEQIDQSSLVELEGVLWSLFSLFGFLNCSTDTSVFTPGTDLNYWILSLCKFEGF